MEEVSRLLSERKFTGTRLRANIVPETERAVYVHPTRGTKLNTTRRRIKSDMLKTSTPLWEAIAGALCFSDGRRISEQGIWHEFDGKIQHWNEPHEGTKYSIILYSRLCTTAPKKAPRCKK